MDKLIIKYTSPYEITYLVKSNCMYFQSVLRKVITSCCKLTICYYYVHDFYENLLYGLIWCQCFNLTGDSRCNKIAFTFLMATQDQSERIPIT